MYRAERFDVHFNVKVSREMRAALRAGAAAEGMGDAHFGRTVIDLGLEAWCAGPARAGVRGGFAGVQRRIPYGSGTLFDFQMSPPMRAALSVGACAEGVRVSDFARMVMDLGLAAWRARRAPISRCLGGA